MKVAISSEEKNLDGKIAGAFGRCPYFLIVEIKEEKAGEFEAIENTGVDQASGAGISAAQLVAGKDIEAVITENVGPRALDVFEQFDIKIYRASGLIKDALQKFIDNKLEEVKKNKE